MFSSTSSNKESSNLLNAFNNHFMEFINDVETVLPNDSDIVLGKKSIILLKKTNPKLLINVWYNCIYSKFKNEIDSGNSEFFINKDYSKDLLVYNEKIMDTINKIKNPIKNMSKEDQQKTMKYIQNLSKISEMYNNNNNNT